MGNKSKTTNRSFTVFYEDYEELKRVPQQFHFEIDTTSAGLLTSGIDLHFTKRSSKLVLVNLGLRMRKDSVDNDHSYPRIILEKYT